MDIENNKILYINSCVRENSRTDKLARYFIKKSGMKANETKLNTADILSLTAETLKKRDNLIKDKNFDDTLFLPAKQFIKARNLLISAPYWDLSFPSLLKVYFEAINVSGLVFYYDENGCPKTLCDIDRMIYITTSGGYIKSDDFGFGYIKALCETFYEIPKIYYVKAEGLDIIGNNTDEILNTAKVRIDEILSDNNF